MVAASSPVMSGMSKSISSISGASARTRRIASLAEAHTSLTR